MEIQAHTQVEQAKLQSNERVKAVELETDRVRVEGDLALRDRELALEQQKVALEALSTGIEASGTQNEHQEKLLDTFLGTFAKLEQIRQQPVQKVKEEVSKNVDSLSGELERVKQNLSKITAVVGDLQHLKSEVQRMATGLEAVAAVNKKRKPKKVSLKKDDGKTKGVVVTYDDGTTEEVSIN